MPFDGRAVQDSVRAALKLPRRRRQPGHDLALPPLRWQTQPMEALVDLEDTAAVFEALEIPE